MPDRNTKEKITRGFEQATDSYDVCFTLDPDMYITGNVGGFLADVIKRGMWKGAAGLRIHYKHWERHPELTGKDNAIFRLVNPYRVKCNPHHHGQYLKDGKMLLPAWTSPHITIIHDDSKRNNTANTTYHNNSEKHESSYMNTLKLSLKAKCEYKAHRLTYRIMQRINPEYYPRFSLSMQTGSVVSGVKR